MGLKFVKFRTTQAQYWCSYQPSQKVIRLDPASEWQSNTQSPMLDFILNEIQQILFLVSNTTSTPLITQIEILMSITWFNLWIYSRSVITSTSFNVHKYIFINYLDENFKR